MASPPLPPNLPLAWFGVYRAPAIYDHATGRLEGASDLPVMEHVAEEMPERFSEHVDLTIAREDYCCENSRDQAVHRRRRDLSGQFHR